MKKCLIIPDSFKGTMTSAEVCEIMKIKLAVAFPNCRIIDIPAAERRRHRRLLSSRPCRGWFERNL